MRPATETGLAVRCCTRIGCCIPRGEIRESAGVRVQGRVVFEASRTLYRDAPAKKKCPDRDTDRQGEDVPERAKTNVSLC